MSLSSKAHGRKYEFPGAERLWHSDKGRTDSLGCLECSFKPDCGGLSVGAGFYDCDSLCRCLDRARCNKVCPNNPTQFVERMREVNGLALSAIPRAPAARSVSLPRVLPMIYHASRRTGTFDGDFVVLSLYKLFDKATGHSRFRSPEELRVAFRVTADAKIVVSGTHTDPSLERFWGVSDRIALLRELACLNIELISTPNYSLFCDAPRLDDLHSIMRIGITCSEGLRCGIPTALHVNARTEADYERWGEFIDRRSEIEWLAFEFATGAGHGRRIGFHIAQLTQLAQRISRPLRLLIRGGAMEIRYLLGHFECVSLIDTTAFMKTQHRQRARLENGALVWEPMRTRTDESLDLLLQHNASAVARARLVQ